MKSLSKIAGIVAAVIIAVSFIFDDNNVNQPGNKDNNVATQNSINSYAMRAADNTWPALNDGQSIQMNDLMKKNYYLVFDGSGSMKDSNCSNGKSKIAVAKIAVTGFINKIPGDANIGLAIFDARGTSERAVLGGSNKQNVIHQVQQASAGGGTPLKSSIEHAYKALKQQAMKQLGYGEYHLIVITDGEASGGEDPRYVVDDLLNHSPVVLHTIGFCIEGGHSLNQAGYTFYKSASNPEQLAMGLESVLAETSDFEVDSFEGQLQ